jgi:hypothetical protein
MKKTLLLKLLTFSLFALLSVGMVNAQVFITEIADPNNNLQGRYTELFNAGTSDVDLTGWRLDKYVNGVAPASQTINLVGTIPAGGFYIIATGSNDGDFLTIYGVTADLFDNDDSNNGVAGSNGDDPLELYNGATLVDQYGAPGIDGTGLNWEFEDGRAERVATVLTAQAVYAEENWNVWSDGPGGDIVLIQDAPANFDPRAWIGKTEVTVATDLFISEYVEGSTGNDRAIEIFNGTGADVDLSAYSVKQSYGGEGWGIRGGVAMIEYVLPLSGTLANGDVFVIFNAETTNPAILAVGDLGLTYASGLAGCRNASFTGNDPMGLFKNDVLIDAIGIELSTTGPWDVAGVTGATMDHTLVRKNTITEGTTDWAVSAGTNAEDSQWIVYPAQYMDDLGIHTFGVVADVTAPVLTSSPKDDDTEVAINAPIVLTFDEAIRNIDDSEITDANIAALLTLKETDASGADVAFTATIDAAKRVITVTPAADLAIGQVYYGAIAPIEDAADNATTEMSMTFTTITKYIVTFNVDMSLVKGFDPATDTVYIAGTVNGWTEPGKDLAYILTDADGNMTYTIALALDIPVGDIAYKFFINAGWNTWGEWVGDPNRTATITENTTLNAIFGNQGGPVFVNVPYAQDFEYSTANASMSLAGWTNANVEAGGTALWLSKTFNLNKYGQVTSFGATSTGADQIWLITPGILMADSLITDLSFDVNVGYYTHDGLTVKISTDYDQTVEGITTATWTDVTREFVIPSVPVSGYGTFTNAGHLDVSAYTGTMYVAFVYDGNKTASQTTTYQLDNVAVNVLGYVGLNKMSKSEVTIYPNPSNGRLQITNPSNEAQEIAVFNSLGKQVKTAVSAKGIISLDISSQSKGFYLIRLTNKANKSVQYKKIVLN